MKNIRKLIIVTIVTILILSTNVIAHDKNIKGYNDKNSNEITKSNRKYYGYHNENGIRHYHQVKWNEEEHKWNIMNPAVYYDENLNIIDRFKEKQDEKIEAEYYDKVDGDTAEFKLKGEIIKVRFLGINTPETVDTTKGEEPYGKEASNYTTERLENADKIEIECDLNADEKDKYQRILAWIWVDDSLLQKELVEKGLADTYMLQNNYRYAGILQLAKEEAENNKVGIWSNKVIDNNTENKNIINNTNNQIDNKIVILIIIIIFGIVAIVFGKGKKVNKKNNKI